MNGMAIVHTCDGCDTPVSNDRYRNVTLSVATLQGESGKVGLQTDVTVESMLCRACLREAATLLGPGNDSGESVAEQVFGKIADAEEEK
jgi:hypothetical protein